jgi:hypothetical protein
MTFEIAVTPIPQEKIRSKRDLFNVFLSTDELQNFRHLPQAEKHILTLASSSKKEFLFATWSERSRAWQLLPSGDMSTLLMVDGNTILMKDGGEFNIGSNCEILVRK